MSATVLGVMDWGMTRDQEGHRTYNLKTLIKTDDYNDGPATVMFASGLPLPGSLWAYGNDFDPWAFCYPNLTVQPIVKREKNLYWTADQIFSTKPLRRCQDTSIDNPLAEPARISGTFAQDKRMTDKDRNGATITSSSLEPIRIEAPDCRPSVVIEMNTGYLELDLFSEMINTVNDSPLWGLPARHIMLSNISWARLLYGTCTYYFTRKFEFQVQRGGYDITDMVDKGFKVVRGEWNGTTHEWEPSGDDPTDPNNFVVYTDENGHAFPTATLLDGSGNPLTDLDNPVFIPTIERDPESNFYALGVPSYLD